MDLEVQSLYNERIRRSYKGKASGELLMVCSLPFRISMRNPIMHHIPPLAHIHASHHTFFILSRFRYLERSFRIAKLHHTRHQPKKKEKETIHQDTIIVSSPSPSPFRPSRPSPPTGTTPLPRPASNSLLTSGPIFSCPLINNRSSRASL